ncbi:GIY-YIG nuclease family protein [Lactococcus cremoris]|uniref:GIY-YIG nuclease family protein n=1 Tax=Lactococcus lactis subsp. cremoris TaxID=1359 RepID=UPI002FC9FEEE
MTNYEIIQNRMATLSSLLDMLSSKTFTKFNGLKPVMLPDKMRGVYVIYDIKSDPSDPKILYVGRTNNLRSRIYNNHLMGNESTARLKKHLTISPAYLTISDMALAKKFFKEKCAFKFISFPNAPRNAALAEFGLTSILQPEFLDLKPNEI